MTMQTKSPLSKIPTIELPPINKIETISIPLPEANVPYYIPMVVPPVSYTHLTLPTNREV